MQKHFLLILLLLFWCSIASAQNALDHKVNFSVQNLSLQESLVKLSKQSGVNISFSNQVLKETKVISLNLKKKTVKSILLQLLKGTDLDYEILENEVIIKAIINQKFTISGTVEEGETGENLLGANVYVARSSLGTTTNEYGFFSLTLPKGPIELVVSYLGFEKKTISLNLLRDTSISIKMLSNLTFPEVIITDKKEESLLNKDISTTTLDPKKISKIPALGGIPDVLRASHLLSGVQSGGDGLGGLFVRGGNTDQNLVLLDGVPVYNPTHFVGLISIFNTKAVRSSEFIKGGFPARYGGRLSSVMDVRIKEGNRYKLTGDASLGLVAASASLEGPLAKGKGAFFISGRRSIPDLLIKPLTRRVQLNNGIDGFLNYYFFDINAKANYSLSRKDKVYLSYYRGQDKFQNPSESIDVIDDFANVSKDDQDLDWGNTIGSLRYNRIWNNKLFSNLTVTLSRYQFATEEFTGSKRTEMDSIVSSQFDYSKFNTAIQDITAKLDFDYFPNATTRVKLGISGIRHTFRPRVINLNEDNMLGIDFDDIGPEIDSLFATFPINTYEIDAYLEGETKHTDRIKTNLGIHFASFLTDGKNYVSVQPRIATFFQLSKRWYANASFSISSQYLHLLTRSGIGLPTDLWVPSTARIKPQTSWIGVVGFGYENQKKFSFGVEAYYKQLNDILAYREGTIFSVIDAENWEENVDVGNGVAYGIEFEAAKKTNKTEVWLNYTYSIAEREFKDVNQGQLFPFRYDRRHFLKTGLLQKFNNNFSVSLDYVYGTGNPITIATNRFEYYNEFNELPTIVQVPGEKNSFRMRPYHRLDAGVHLTKVKKWGVEEFSFGAYNAYARLNPLFISLRDDPNIAGEKQFFQVSLLSIVPYITYVVSF